MREVALQLKRSYHTVDWHMSKRRRSNNHQIKAAAASSDSISEFEKGEEVSAAAAPQKAAVPKALREEKHCGDGATTAAHGRVYSPAEHQILDTAFKRYIQLQQVKKRRGRWIEMVRRLANRLGRSVHSVSLKMSARRQDHNKARLNCFARQRL